MGYIEFDVPTAKDKSNWHKAIKIHLEKDVQYVKKRYVVTMTVTKQWAFFTNKTTSSLRQALIWENINQYSNYKAIII